MDAGDIASIVANADKYFEEEVKNIIEVEANNALEDMLSEGGYAREQMVSWIQDGILEAVYGVYTPRKYVRRGLYDGSGGIGDPRNIVISYGYEDGSITIDYENIATGNKSFQPTNGNLEGIILSGSGYNYPETGTGYFASPRDFYCVLDEEWGDGSFIIDNLEAVVNKAVNKIAKSLYIACVNRALNEYKGVK